MKKIFLLFALCLSYSQIFYANPKILNDNFFKTPRIELATALSKCNKFTYNGCDKIYTKEISQLIKECNGGNGKYSACQKLLKISDASCYQQDKIENFLACNLSGDIFIITNKFSMGLERLARACNEGKIGESCLNYAMTLLYYSLDVDEVVRYMTAARNLAVDKEILDSMLKKLNECKADKECNPARINFLP